MRITILSLGSRGDVQPFLALAVGLQKTGRHKVRFAAPDNFESLAREYNLKFTPLGVDTQILLGAGGIDPDRNVLLWFWEVIHALKPLAEKVADNTWLACQDSEFIIYSMMGIGAYHVAEKLGIPCIMASPIPGFEPTRAYPNPNGLFPSLSLGGEYNWLTHIVSRYLFQLIIGPPINRWRKVKLDLPAIPFTKYPYSHLGGLPQTILGCYSSVVSPKPLDWGENVRICGYWFLDPPSDWQPSTQLSAFIEEGEPPVYFGFGSMANRAPKVTAEIAQEALEKTGKRGIFATGWGGLDKVGLSDQILVLDSIPHAWLFPRMAAVVHHGGAGTTAAGLRAGIPSIVIPHLGDQRYWGQRVKELGVGPDPISIRNLTSERLAAAITSATTDLNLQARAATLGEYIRSEDGVARATEIIESLSH
jgi:sterol 3beta-glucosyltransferase